MSSEEGTKTNAIVNVDIGKVLEKAYDDILSPPSKKVGEALGTILDLTNTILYPVKILNTRTKLYFEQNMKKYEEKLNQIPEDKITEVPTEISKPILDRFTYTSNEELSDAFVNLLSNASSINNINLAHPGFIQIIDRISPDEAKILKNIHSDSNLLICASGKLTISTQFSYDVSNIKDQYEQTKLLQCHFPVDIQDILIFKNELNINLKEKFVFYNNRIMYVDNLKSLGLIKETDNFSQSEYEYIRTMVEKIKTNYNVNDYYRKKKHIRKEYHDPKICHSESHNYKVSQKVYKLTEYGLSFINACLKDFKNTSD